MANYTILPEESFFTNDINGGRVYTGTTGADSLTIAAGTLLYSLSEDTGFNVPIELDNRGVWTLTVNGSLWSQAGNGVFLDPGITGTKTSTVTVGTEGSIYGKYAGIDVGGFDDDVYASAPVTIKNNGEIGGSTDSVVKGIGIYFNITGAHTVTNTGHVYGYWGIWSKGSAADTITNSGRMAWVGAGDGTNKMVNTGALQGYFGGSGADSVENNGIGADIGYEVNLHDGTNTLKNSGTINDHGTINGVIAGSGADTITNSGDIYGGLSLGDGTNKLTNTGWIGDVDHVSYQGGAGADTITNTGTTAKPTSFSGQISLGDGTNSYVGNGSVGANDGTSILGGNDGDIVTNNGPGSFAGNVSLGDGTNQLTNSGEIASGASGYSYVGGADGDTVANTNSKTTTAVLDGAVDLGDGTNSLSNSGTIGVVGGLSVHGGSNNDSISNSGTLLGGVWLGEGTNSLTNSKQIDGDITGGTGNDTFTNTASGIVADVDLGGGTNKVTNSGLIATLTTGDGTDTVGNAGTITDHINTGGGNDTFTNYVGKVQGTVNGTIDLGGGADKFVGGNNAETVIDNDGADTIGLGAGDDHYNAVGAGDAAIDSIDGGTGIDSYDASDATSDLFINLSTTTQVDSYRIDPNTSNFYSLAAGKAVGDDVGIDLVKNIEIVHGGSGDDIIIGRDGSTAGDALYGNDGNDDIAGLGGADTLVGGAGNDGLYGGAGKDVLTGGDGNGPDGDVDYFVYAGLSDSGMTAATRDVITDFELGVDKIDLHLIDAITSSGHTGDQDFDFIGTNVAFSHTAGELRAYWTVSGQIVEGDVNGDGRADFSIELYGLSPSDIFLQSDFIV